jgi:MFS family permease
MINLRHAARAQPGPIDVRAIPRRYLAIFANPRAKICFLAVFLEGVLLLAMAGETRAAIAGAVLAGYSIGGVAYSLAVSELRGRWRAQQLMIGGGFAALLALVVIAMDIAWPVQFMAFIVLGIGFYSFHGCIQVAAREFSQTARGAAMSLHSFFFFVAQASGAVLYGIGFARLGPTRSVWLGGATMALTGFMCAHFLRRSSPAICTSTMERGSQWVPSADAGPRLARTAHGQRRWHTHRPVAASHTSVFAMVRPASNHHDPPRPSRRAHASDHTTHPRKRHRPSRWTPIWLGRCRNLGRDPHNASAAYRAVLLDVL